LKMSLNGRHAPLILVVFDCSLFCILAFDSCCPG
jgi:hypothetical protein